MDIAADFGKSYGSFATQILSIAYYLVIEDDYWRGEAHVYPAKRELERVKNED